MVCGDGGRGANAACTERRIINLINRAAGVPYFRPRGRGLSADKRKVENFGFLGGRFPHTFCLTLPLSAFLLSACSHRGFSMSRLWSPSGANTEQDSKALLWGTDHVPALLPFRILSWFVYSAANISPGPLSAGSFDGHWGNIGASGEESACHCRSLKKHGFDSWVAKTPWRREWQPTPVFLPGQLHGQEPGRLQSMGLHKLDKTE